MNESKMIEVLGWIEDEKAAFAAKIPGAVGFNMMEWYSQILGDEASGVCGTTACLAGHAALMAGKRLEFMSADSIASAGAEFLELEGGADSELFYLDTLDDVYDMVAHLMGVDEQVLRDKVQAERKQP